MGVFSFLAKSMVYPLTRPAKQAKDSYEQIKGDILSLKEAREFRVTKAQEDLRAHLERIKDPNWEGAKPTQDELLNPALIKDPFIRFEVLYSVNGWTPETLKKQINAVKLTKISASYSSVFILFIGIVSLIFLPVWMVLILGPILLTAGAVGFASAVKHAIYQFQLENRKLIGFSELSSRSDFISYLFSR